MKFLTWNIQWGLGLDGRVDLERIVRTAKAMADFDVWCVQEVADNFPGLDGNDERDQFAELGRLLPGYTRLEGYAVDVAGEDGRRRRFGNAMFTRYPVHSVRRHALPWPAEPAKKTMPRMALEATLETAFGPLRATTTHLEYYSAEQRRAQVRRLRNLHDEACQRATITPRFENTGSNVTFDPTPQATAAIVCGDFNVPADDSARQEMQSPLARGGPALRDAWEQLNPGKPHPPTFCVHNRTYSKSPVCCDFIFVSQDLVPRLQRISVNVATQDSDHQPVLLELED
ncbi:MAG TPA: endonuclease/exonuclease/phosphatase family protein [Usitatibacter sp.]|nr:endonuclease/exonuclease/phosphatase family protein [Usitatibacter sp.]